MTIDREKEAILDDQIAKGQNMQAVLNGGLSEFFEAKQIQLFQAFMECSPGDTSTLVSIHHGAKAMHSLRLEVQGVVDSGKISAAQKEQENAQL